jgi:hypothetical protein
MVLRKIKIDPRATILKCVGVAVLLSTLFPPWLYVFDKSATSSDAGGHWEVSAGFHCLFNAPASRIDDVLSAGHEALGQYYQTFHSFAGVKLDILRLRVECGCFLAIGATVWGVVQLNHNKHE